MVEGGLLGNQQGDVGVTSTATTSSSSATTSGPSLSISTSDGSEVVLDRETIEFYLLTLQVVLMVYVAYKEASGG